VDIPSIEWRRVAEPQQDEYDTEVVLDLAARRGYQRQDPAGEPTFFDGAIAIRNGATFVPGTEPAPLDHPNIARACELVRLWPEGFRQCRRLLDGVEVFVGVGGVEDRVLGSVCHAGTRGFGSIKSTVDHHAGFAQALVHEMSHHKLRALGVGSDAAERFVLNPAHRRYRSPIRHDCLRPMPAVLHAQYSYTHVAALDMAIIEAATDPLRDRRIAAESLAVLLPKLEFGRNVIADGAEVDRPGAEFLLGLFEWLARLLERGFALLEQLHVTAVPFAHPLDRDAGPPSPRALEAALGYPPFRPRRRADVEAYPVRDEMVLYCPVREGAFALNRSSRSIWELCDGERTLGEITQALALRLQCTDSALWAEIFPDVAATVERFQRDGLLDLSRASPEPNVEAFRR
jgi:hypothetical protein